MNRLNEIASTKGFKLYRHSDCASSNGREYKLILLCSAYSQTRCPFMLIWRKDIAPANTEQQESSNSSMFTLQKYRPEHNHPLAQISSGLEVVMSDGSTPNFPSTPTFVSHSVKKGVSGKKSSLEEHVRSNAHSSTSTPSDVFMFN